MILYKHLKKTLLRFPSQWRGISNKGEEIYIRYRWDYLTLYLNDEEIICFKCDENDHCNGSMRTKTMLHKLKDYIARDK